MNWIQLGASMVAILVLAGIAWALKLGGGVTLADENAAISLAENELSGFDAEGAWLSVDGAAAVVIGKDGSVAVLRRHGAHFVSRRLRAPDFRQIDEYNVGGRIEIDTAEGQVGNVSITLQNRWQADELAQALSTAKARTSAPC